MTFQVSTFQASSYAPAFENWVAMTNVYQNLDENKGSGWFLGCEGKVILHDTTKLGLPNRFKSNFCHILPNSCSEGYSDA